MTEKQEHDGSEEQHNEHRADAENMEPYIRIIQQETHAWRTEKFGEVQPTPQLLGTMVELSEMGDMLVKAEYYDEGWADDERLKEEAGDVMVYFLGVLSCLGYDVVECIEVALDKNQTRDWDEHMSAPGGDE